MTRKKDKQLNWGVERRYEFIEFRLFWQGRINRGDLMDAFGVSTQQASLDLNAYIEQDTARVTPVFKEAGWLRD